VLLAEDPSPARSRLITILSRDPEIHVVGEASDGAEAIALTLRLRPDLVTMDIQLPGVDGFEATRRIMIEAPTPILVVTGTVEHAGIAASMRALRAGALMVLPRPGDPASPGFEQASAHLVAMVKAMAAVKVVGRRGSRARKAPRQSPVPAPAVRLVAVGASTGGPSALYRLLMGFPRDFAAPILVVQHITPGFISGLAEWLDTASHLRVEVATHGARLAPRTVYLAPDDTHLGLLDAATICLSKAEPVGGFRPSATHLFSSVAAACGPGCVAVIMTGMGEDGVAGLRSIHRAGGQILAQDEDSCVVFGMPGAAVAAGLADAVLPLAALAPRVSRLINTGSPLGRSCS
jgi:two-component system chemotaxis response regulator CheB